MLLFITSALLIVLSTATYPSIYPFDDGIPTTLPLTANTANFAGEMEAGFNFDEGGFIARFLEFSFDDVPPFYPDFGILEYTGAWSYFLFNSGVASHILYGTVNCSNNMKYGLFWKPHIHERLNLENGCQNENCCDTWIGYPATLLGASASVELVRPTLREAFDAGKCPPPAEHTYCSILYTDSYSNFCTSNIKSPTVRVKELPCFDVLWRYFAACKLYGNVGFLENAVYYESAKYISKITVAESLTVVSAASYPDRVCLPASYYDIKYQADYTSSGVLGGSLLYI